MNKTVMYLFISIGGAIGGFIPVLFGAGGVGLWSVLGSTIGGLAGIWAATKLS
ncbi:MAG TPA: hypothetical protein PKD20_03905 [Candidatus Saccharibacteria bacterium]|jgi:hypothetical protein|nr:hypothetical protein [Candidatus Saccharibacteria bacterium]HMT55993.1 hypothetical protein [Candidatus Saccharibacteria bacterium]